MFNPYKFPIDNIIGLDDALDTRVNKSGDIMTGGLSVLGTNSLVYEGQVPKNEIASISNGNGTVSVSIAGTEVYSGSNTGHYSVYYTNYEGRMVRVPYETGVFEGYTHASWSIKVYLPTTTADLNVNGDIIDGKGNNLSQKQNRTLTTPIVVDGTSYTNLEDAMTAINENSGSGGADLSVIATPFSTSTSYAVGEYVTYEGKLYKCTTAHSAGAWNNAHFTKTTVDDELDGKEDVMEYTSDTNVLEINLQHSALVSDMTVDISPIQDLHGYDHPWVGGAGKNKLTGLEQGTYNSSGSNASSNVRLRSIGYCDILPNTTYTVSASALSTIRVSISVFDEKDTERSSVSGWQNLPFTFTTSSTSKYVRVLIMFSGEATITPSDVSNAQLEIGQTATDYAPYSNICPISGISQLDIDDIGKNKLPITLASLKALNTGGSWSGNVYTYHNGTITVITDNNDYVIGIRANGTFNAYTAFSLGKFVGISGTSYKENGCPKGGSSSKYDIIVVNGGYDNGSGLTFTASGSAQAVSIELYQGYNAQNLMFYPMIRLASETDETFSAYPRQTIIDLGDTRYEVNIDTKSGIMTVNRGLKEYDGSSDEGWYAQGTQNVSTWGYKCTAPKIQDAKVPANNSTNANIICNSFRSRTANDTYFGTEGISIGKGNGDLLMIYCKSYSSSDISLWKSYLANNPLQVCYELATPIVVQLTPATLNLIKGYNYISVNGNTVISKLNAFSDDTVKYLEPILADKLNSVNPAATGQLTIDGVSIQKYATKDSMAYQTTIYASQEGENTFAADYTDYIVDFVINGSIVDTGIIPHTYGGISVSGSSMTYDGSQDKDVTVKIYYVDSVGVKVDGDVIDSSGNVLRNKLNSSDISAWAKASVKPSYSDSEISGLGLVKVFKPTSDYTAKTFTMVEGEVYLVVGKEIGLNGQRAGVWLASYSNVNGEALGVVTKLHGVANTQSYIEVSASGSTLTLGSGWTNTWTIYKLTNNA